MAVVEKNAVCDYTVGAGPARGLQVSLLVPQRRRDLSSRTTNRGPYGRHRERISNSSSSESNNRSNLSESEKSAQTQAR